MVPRRGQKFLSVTLLLVEAACVAVVSGWVGGLSRNWALLGWPGPFADVAFSGSGDSLVAAGTIGRVGIDQSGKVFVCDSDRAIVRHVIADEEPIFAPCLCAASSEIDDSVYVGLANGAVVRVGATHSEVSTVLRPMLPAWPFNLDVSPSGSTVIAYGWDEITVTDGLSSDVVKLNEAGIERATCAVWSESERFLVVGVADKQGENGAVAILDVGEEFSLVANYALPDEVRSVDWNSASDRFCCAAGMVLFLFEFSGNRLTLLKQVNSSESEDVREVEFDPTGRVLASAGEDGSLRLWDARDLQHLDTILTTDEWVTGIGFNPRDSQLAATTSDGKIRMWDIDLQTASATPVKIGNGFDFHRGAVLISGWCVLRCIILIVRRQRKRFSLEV